MLSRDEQVQLMIRVRWERIDLPRTFRWCVRLPRRRWLLTAGWFREWPGLVHCKRTDFETFCMWEVGVGWLHCWWPRPARLEAA